MSLASSRAFSESFDPLMGQTIFPAFAPSRFQNQPRLRIPRKNSIQSDKATPERLSVRRRVRIGLTLD